MGDDTGGTKVGGVGDGFNADCRVAVGIAVGVGNTVAGAAAGSTLAVDPVIGPSVGAGEGAAVGAVVGGVSVCGCPFANEPVPVAPAHPRTAAKINEANRVIATFIIKLIENSSIHSPFV